MVSVPLLLNVVAPSASVLPSATVLVPATVTPPGAGHPLGRGAVEHHGLARGQREQHAEVGEIAREIRGAGHGGGVRHSGVDLEGATDGQRARAERAVGRRPRRSRQRQIAAVGAARGRDVHHAGSGRVVFELAALGARGGREQGRHTARGPQRRVDVAGAVADPDRAVADGVRLDAVAGRGPGSVLQHGAGVEHDVVAPGRVVADLEAGIGGVPGRQRERDRLAGLGVIVSRVIATVVDPAGSATA